MTQLTNPTDTRLTARRRDSPRLWWLVATGSLLLHVAVFWGIRWFNLRVSMAQPQLDAVPIELIDDTPQPTATLAPAAPKPATPEPAAADIPASTAPAQSEPPNPSNRNPSPAPEARSAPTSQPSSATPRGESPRPTAPRPFSDPTPSPPVAPPFTPPAPPPPSSPLPSGASTHPNPLPPTPANNGASAPQPVSPPGSSPIPPGESGELPDAPVDQQESQQPFREITASLTARSVPVLIDGSAHDVPEQSASPKQTTRSFTADLTSGVFGSASVGDTASCELKPEVRSLLSSEPAVSLRLYIDQQGKVLDATPIAEDDAYAQLAGCLLKQWEFTPAMSAGSPVESNDLVVEVILTQN